MFTTTTFKEFFNIWANLEGINLTSENALEYFTKSCNETDIMFDNADDHCFTAEELTEFYNSDEEVELTVHETPQDWEFLFHTDEGEEFCIVIMEPEPFFEQLGLR